MTKQNSIRQVYGAEIELFFDYNNIREKITSERIEYLMVESDYENQVLPVIYLSLSVSNSLYNNIINYRNSAKFYLKVKRKNKNSKMSLSKTTIDGLFSYVTSTTNSNYSNELNLNSVDPYRRILIGLVSVKLTNLLRKSFNEILNDVDTTVLIAKAIEGTNCIVERPTYNTYYNSILIPPISSRYRLLKFIFDKNPFYNTNFRYFMDFEKSYLVSKEGNPIDSQNDELSSTIIDIRPITSNEAYYDGIQIKNNSYYVYINPSNSNIIVNEGTEKITNQIVTVDDDGNIKLYNLDMNQTDDSEIKQEFIRVKSDNSVYKNEYESDSVIVEIVKQYIDGTPFTPDKCVTISNYGEYEKYNGRYLVLYKREFYKCVAGEFILSCNVGLKKISNIVTPNSSSTNRKTMNTSSSIRKSTSDMKNTTRIANFRE